MKFKSSKASINDLTFDQLFENGAFGQVYRGTYYNQIISIKKLTVLLDEKARKDLPNEAEILSKLSYSYIIGHITGIKTQETCYLVLKYDEKGSLE